jgi:hypothetical protein
MKGRKRKGVRSRENRYIKRSNAAVVVKINANRAEELYLGQR